MIFVLAGLNACGGDNSVPTFVQAVPKTLAVTGGDKQTGFVTGKLDTALAVSLTDANGLAVVGSPVTWTVTSGGGTVANATVTSDAFGVSKVVWTLGNAAGAQAVTASSVATPTATASFTATAVAPNFAIESGNTQTAAAGDTVANPLTILVTDASAAPVEGVRVDFAVASGGGFFDTADSAKTTSVLSDAKGEAAIKWILGPTIGSQSATATVGAATPVTFTAIAQ